MNIIQGQKFKTLAHHIYAPPRGPNPDSSRNQINNIGSSDYRYISNTLINGDSITATGFTLIPFMLINFLRLSGT